MMSAIVRERHERVAGVRNVHFTRDAAGPGTASDALSNQRRRRGACTAAARETTRRRAPAERPASAPWRPGCRPSSRPPSARRSRCARAGSSPAPLRPPSARSAGSGASWRRRSHPTARGPAAMSCSIWSTRMIELRMMMPESAIVPSMATKPNGSPEHEQAGGHADEPERRGQQHHQRAREALQLDHRAASAP